MSERFEVCKYSGGRKEEKQNRDIKKKEKRERESFGEAVPEIIPETSKKEVRRCSLKC